MAEDCLYLNIWTPALRGCGSGSEIRTDSRCDGHGLPVMVWLYGGAFQTGSTCEKEFNGEQLARQGVVVVSIAYWLNVFGFSRMPCWKRKRLMDGLVRISDFLTSGWAFSG